MTVADDEAIAIQTLVDEFNKQKITSDYFNIPDNATNGMLNPGTTTDLDGSCFPVTGVEILDDMGNPTGTDGAKFEFFLSASIDGSPDSVPDQNYVSQVALVEDDGTGTFNAIAVASYADDDMSTDRRNFSIFYKGEVAMDETKNYKVQLTTSSNAGILPVLLNQGDVQWGFKVYRDEYPLEPTLPTC